MTIQEALNKVRDLKAEASKVIAEADEQKTRTYYLDVDRSTYPILKRDTMDLINTYSDLQRQIHQLKFQIQATNVSCGITQLIQELDFLTSQHNALERFGDETQVTDPILVGERFGSPSSSGVLPRLPC